ncbi:tyrosine-type recombinase/integrase [Candidatus Obscuribacterales bacterium]|nr:tyrosine-type recombinase/integrase [Candidatus Obscuribacterales bacterium]
MTKDGKGEKKFSAKHIRALQCPPGMRQQYVLVSPDIHLYVSVGNGGTKAFCFRAKVNQAWRTLFLDCKFDDSLPDALVKTAMLEAKSRAAELTARRNRGENVFDAAKVTSTEPTLQDLFTYYQTEHLEKTGRRVKDNLDNFNRWFVKRNLQKRKANDYSHDDASRLHKQMEKTPGSANRAVQLGRAMFNFGIKTRFLKRTDNPFAAVSLYPERERDRVLSDEEAGKLISAISEAPYSHCQERSLADMIMLWLLTGVRKTVVLKMRWSEIDEQIWLWTIPAANMKGRKSQEILLGPAEIEILTARKAMLLEESENFSDFVFPSEKSASGHIEDPGNAWESLRERLDLGDLWIHDLRRSLASAMANTGANVAVVKQALAHTDERTTMKAYIRTTRQVQLDARKKAQEAWFNAANSASAPAQKSEEEE